MERSIEELRNGLATVSAAPANPGVVRLIVRRPAEDEREAVEEAQLSEDDGLVGDTWRARGNRHTPDGSADPLAQVTLMNARAAALIAGDPDRWALAGDQLYVDLDLSRPNLPPGSRLLIGTAELELTDKPHTGCAKFSARFGREALRLVNTPEGQDLRLRGANARVVTPGTIRVGDAIHVRPSPE